MDLEVIAMDGIPGGSHRSPFANANKPLMPRRGCGGPGMQVYWHATYAIEGMPLRGWELAASLCASLSDHLSTHQTPYSAINHPPSFSFHVRLLHQVLPQLPKKHAQFIKILSKLSLSQYLSPVRGRRVVLVSVTGGKKAA